MIFLRLVKLNKYFFIILITGLISIQIKSEESISSDLEEVNVYESLKKTGDVEPTPVPNNEPTVKAVPADTVAPPVESSSQVKMSELEEQDDLQSLKEDIGDAVIDKDKDKDKKAEVKSEDPVKTTPETIKEAKKDEKSDLIGEEKAEEKTDEKIELSAKDKELNLELEEKKLLQQIAKEAPRKIPSSEWNEIVSKAKLEKYEVKQGEDTLWKILIKHFMI